MCLQFLLGFEFIYCFITIVIYNFFYYCKTVIKELKLVINSNTLSKSHVIQLKFQPQIFMYVFNKNSGLSKFKIVMPDCSSGAIIIKVSQVNISIKMFIAYKQFNEKAN